MLPLSKDIFVEFFRKLSPLFKQSILTLLNTWGREIKTLRIVYAMGFYKGRLHLQKELKTQKFTD